MRVTSARGLLVTLKGSVKAVECASWRGEGRGGRDKGKRGREDKKEGSKKEEKGKVKAKGKRRKEGKRERLEKEEKGRKARSFQRSGAGMDTSVARIGCSVSSHGTQSSPGLQSGSASSRYPPLCVVLMPS